jgi:hypothetical protein
MPCDTVWCATDVRLLCRLSVSLSLCLSVCPAGYVGERMLSNEDALIDLGTVAGMALYVLQPSAPPTGPAAYMHASTCALYIQALHMPY